MKESCLAETSSSYFCRLLDAAIIPNVAATSEQFCKQFKKQK